VDPDHLGSDQEGGHRGPPRAFRQPGVRRSVCLYRAAADPGDGILCVPDLLRFFRVFRYRDRYRAVHGIPADGQFRPALPRDQHRRILAALAYLALDLVPRLCVYPAWRQPRTRGPMGAECPDRLRPERSLAWRQLDLCRLGRPSRPVSYRRTAVAAPQEGAIGIPAQTRPLAAAGRGLYPGDVRLDLFPGAEPFSRAVYRRPPVYRAPGSVAPDRRQPSSCAAPARLPEPVVERPPHCVGRIAFLGGRTIPAAGTAHRQVAGKKAPDAPLGFLLRAYAGLCVLRRL